MSRDATSDVISATQSEVVLPVAFVEMDFDSGTLYLNSLDHDVSWNSQTWLGVGRLGAMSALEETSEVRPAGMRFAISGIQSADISLALGEDYSGRTVKVWQGFLDSDYQLIVDPALMFEGMIDQMHIESGEVCSIEVTAENELARWNVPNERRYTNADQQKEFPGDKGLEFVSQVVDKELIWGGQGTSTGQIPVTTGGGGGIPAGGEPGNFTEDVPGGAVA